MSGSITSGRARLAVVFGLMVVLGCGAALWHGGAIGQEAKKEVSQKPIHQAQQLSTAFRKAAEVAMPSVVTVRSKTKAKPMGLKGTPFEDMFPEGFGNMQP